MEKDNRIYCDMSGDACPPDGRYDKALTAVVAIGKPGTAHELAHQMVTFYGATGGYGELEWASAVQTAQTAIDFWEAE